MVVNTFFATECGLIHGQVEVKLLPGLPVLHVLGLPDASIRECSLKLKSALKSSGYSWPSGQQIVVSLRPAELRKGGVGVELAIAMAYLVLTDQLPEAVVSQIKESVVYGELSLFGEVSAPNDIVRALRVVGNKSILTGRSSAAIHEGKWLEISHLADKALVLREAHFSWSEHWQAPIIPDRFMLSEPARIALLLTSLMKLHVLVAGPQGSGKTTWAKLAHALSEPPHLDEAYDRAALFGDESLFLKWRPIEHPHHSSTVQALVGGGLSISPGVISRAHGGVLLMDEFLEFSPAVLEALREPIESGFIEIARKGRRERLPARFQLVATANLCPCGKLNPLVRRQCGYSLVRCRSVVSRLSGPLLDRFDLLVLSHEWTDRGLSKARRVWSLEEIAQDLARARTFARERNGALDSEIPGWAGEILPSHRRRQSLLRVARGLADLEESIEIKPGHFNIAYDLVSQPMEKMREVFA